MALKDRLHPSLLLTLVPIAVTTLTLCMIGWRWQDLAIGMPPRIAYWFLRAVPLPNLVLGPIGSLLTVWALPLHRRQPIAFTSLLCFLCVAGFYALGEYARLAPWVENGVITWNEALTYLDAFAVAGTILGVGIVAISARISIVVSDPIKRAKRGVFGNADWLSMPEVAKLFPSDGEIVIGERYRVDLGRVHKLPFDSNNHETWGQGGKAPLMTFNQNFDSTHMLFFAGSGGFKTTSNVIPTALRYRGPLICLDPSTEVAPMVLEHRAHALGREVMVLDPTNPAVGFNVLDGIERSTRKEEDIVGIAHMLLSESLRFDTSSTGSYFQNQAHNLLTGLLAHVMLSPDYAGRRNLRSLRLIVSEPEPSVLAMLRDVQENSPSAFIRETLGVFTNMTEQTFSGVYSTASKDTQWLSLDNYAALVCGNTFESSDIAFGRKDVFLNIPASILRSYPGIGRVIIGSLINAMVRADGDFRRRALFMLDEVDLLGYMRILEEARDRGRKYGITLMLMYQSIGQLERHFGRDGATSWIEGCAFTSYAAIKALDTARNVSAQCGEMTVEVQGRSRNVGWSKSNSARKSESISFQRRPLIMPHEITQFMRKDEQIIIVQGHSPIRCGRAIYFRRKEMDEAAKINRFVNSRL